MTEPKFQVGDIVVAQNAEAWHWACGRITNVIIKKYKTPVYYNLEILHSPYAERIGNTITSWGNNFRIASDDDLEYYKSLRFLFFRKSTIGCYRSVRLLFAGEKPEAVILNNGVCISTDEIDVFISEYDELKLGAK